MKKRNNVIDIMKALGIIMVIIGHSLSSSSPVFSYIYLFHMPLFYVLNGYFLKPLNKNEKMMGYIKKRLKQLIIPYFIGCFAIILLILLKGLMFNGMIDYNSVKHWTLASIYGSGGNTLFNFPSIGIGYFLLTIFFSDLIVKYIISYYDNLGSQLFRIIMIAIIGYNLTFYGLYYPLSIPIALFNSSYIYIGYLIHKENKINKVELRNIPTIVLSLLTLYTMKNYCGVILNVINVLPGGVFGYISSLMGVYLVFCISFFIDKSKRFKKVLSFIGQNTLIIMVIYWIEISCFPYNFFMIRLKNHFNFECDDTILLLIIRVFIVALMFTMVYLILRIINKRWSENNMIEKNIKKIENQETNDKILLFIPGYNCEKQIPRVLKQLDKKVMKFISEIIYVNNLSTDNTEKVVVDFKKKSKLPIKVLRNKENYNLGGSHKVAFNYAIKNKFDYVIVLHGDDQGDIHDLYPYLENGEYKKFDCLLGSRFSKGSKLVGYSKFRIFGNRVFNIIYSICIGQKVKDLGAGLNMYKVEILKNDFYHKFPDRLTFNCCMLFAHNYYKHNIKFIPITWREDDQVSNVKMFSQAKVTLKIALKYRLNKNYVKSEFREKEIDKYVAKEIK